VGARFSAPVQTGHAAQPASCTMGTGYLSPGVRRPGRAASHPTPSVAEANERVVLYLYSPLDLRPVLGFLCLLLEELGSHKHDSVDTDHKANISLSINETVSRSRA
jgi:hypothetical protein